MIKLTPSEERANKVIAIRQSNPCATLQLIGDQVGLTRERVRQILSGAKLPTVGYVERKIYHCMNCGKETPNLKFCSMKCRSEYTWVEAACDECGKLFPITQSALITRLNRNRSNKIRCSRHCNGKWLSREYGFAVHPSHIRLNYYHIAQLYLGGYSYSSICSMAGCSKTTIRNVRFRFGLPRRIQEKSSIDKESFVRLTMQGYDFSHLARYFDVDMQAIYTARHKYGLSGGISQNMRLYNHEEIIRLYNTGMKPRHISFKLGYPRKSVSRILDRHKHERKD